MTNILTSKTPITQDILDTYFPIIHASQLRLSDDYLRYFPQTNAEADLKDYLIKLIKYSEVPDFRAPIMDPSLDNDGNIMYSKGMAPATNESATWWKKSAAEFLPEFGSNIGTLPQYAIFLATLMKYMVDHMKYLPRVAWNLVCTNSTCLMQFRSFSTPITAGHAVGPNAAGQYPVLGPWHDFGNTRKIVALTEKSYIFYQMSGAYINTGISHPLSRKEEVLYPNAPCPCATGWITMPASGTAERPILHHWG